MTKAWRNVLIIFVILFAVPIITRIGTTAYASLIGGASEGEINEVLQSSEVAPMFAAFEEYYPAEAEAFRKKFRDELRSGASRSEMRDSLAAFIGSFHADHADYLKTAPDATLGKVLLAQIEVFKTFEDEPMTCNKVLMLGSSALKPEQLRKLGRVNADMQVALFEASYQGEFNPVQRPPANRENYSQLVSSMIQNGASEIHIQAVIKPDINNPDLCSAFIGYFQAIHDADFPGSSSIRSDIVASLVQAE